MPSALASEGWAENRSGRSSAPGFPALASCSWPPGAVGHVGHVEQNALLLAHGVVELGEQAVHGRVCLFAVHMPDAEHGGVLGREQGLAAAAARKSQTGENCRKLQKCPSFHVRDAEKVNGVWEQRLRIHYNCVGTIEIPSALPLPTPDVSVNTRKGVVVNYAPCDVAI